jgi:transposase-like protein
MFKLKPDIYGWNWKALKPLKSIHTKHLRHYEGSEKKHTLKYKSNCYKDCDNLIDIIAILLS